MDELKHKEQELEELAKTIKLQNKMQEEVVKEKNENLVRLSLANKDLLDEVKVLKKELMNKHLNNMTSFLGKPIGFWIAWNKQITELNLEKVMIANAIRCILLSQIGDIIKSCPKQVGFQFEDYWKIQKILNKAKRVEELAEKWQNQKEN